MADDHDSLRVEIGVIRRNLEEVHGTMTKVAAALERLTRLEERHAHTATALERAFSAISKLENRLSALERQQPMQKLASHWVINGVWAAAGVVGAMIVNKILTGTP
ncbi:hypothetical protein [Castellaniella sp.]|jgi:hypothetical protein|uniref:hypothetical protein n=1 Tax=Castellaniella sp. TaxID=1955812 RepID=UPI002AFF9B64|nr:hypothetical protein [Castellaniella sp.]